MHINYFSKKQLNITKFVIYSMLCDDLRTLKFRQFPEYIARIREYIYVMQATGDDTFTHPLNYLFSAWLNRNFITLILFGYHR